MVSDVVELRYRGRSVRGADLRRPGHADDCVTVHLGYGRTRAGRVGNGAGFNAYALRTADALWFGGGLEIAADGRALSARLHAGPPPDGRPRARFAPSRATSSSAIPESVREGDEHAAAD